MRTRASLLPAAGCRVRVRWGWASWEPRARAHAPHSMSPTRSQRRGPQAERPAEPRVLENERAARRQRRAQRRHCLCALLQERRRPRITRPEQRGVALRTCLALPRAPVRVQGLLVELVHPFSLELVVPTSASLTVVEPTDGAACVKQAGRQRGAGPRDPDDEDAPSRRHPPEGERGYPIPLLFRRMVCCLYRILSAGNASRGIGVCSGKRARGRPGTHGGQAEVFY